jgi:hypothetical protein
VNQTEQLDALIERLERIVGASGPATPGDALDRILAAPGRQSAAASLRDSEVVQAFRNDLIDGLIRIDTANQLFRLVRAVLDRLPLVGAPPPP